MIGIYKITNKINGKVYIGQSWNIERRWKEEKNGQTNSHLKNSIKKYGIDNFIFEVIENLSENINQEEIDFLEKKNILLHSSFDKTKGYNKTFGGNGGKPTQELKLKRTASRSWYKNHSEETKIKMSKSHTGKIVKEETKEKLSKIFKGVKHSEEAMQKIIAFQSKRSKKVKCVETGKIYNSLNEAYRETGIPSGNIGRVISGICKTAGKLHWEGY